MELQQRNRIMRLV